MDSTTSRKRPASPVGFDNQPISSRNLGSPPDAIQPKKRTRVLENKETLVKLDVQVVLQKSPQDDPDMEDLVKLFQALDFNQEGNESIDEDAQWNDEPDMPS